MQKAAGIGAPGRTGRWWRGTAFALALLTAGCGGGGGDANSGGGGGTVTAPVITSQPASVSVAAGGQAVFSVTASGGGLAYQWQRSVNGGLGWSSVSGASAASLTVAPVDATQNGHQFRVVVQNTAGLATSNAATLTVTGANAAPVITLQPVDATTAPLVAATFTANASGTPAPTLQWELSLDGGSTWRAVGGANGTSITAGSAVLGTGVARNFGWRYRMTATNVLGTATSNAAEWRVRPSALGGLPAGLAMAPNGEVSVLVAPNYGDIPLITLTGREAGLVQRISPAGTVTSVAGGSTPGYVDGPGADARFSIPAGVSYGDLGTAGIARDSSGAVYVPDSGNNRIRKVAADGTVSTFAGTGVAGNVDGPVASARFDRPYAVAVASDGTVYVLEANRSLRKISAGTVSSLGPVDALSLAVDSADTLYVVGARVVTRITAGGARSQVGGASGLTVSEDDSVQMVLGAMAVDPTGTMFVADAGLCLVRRISAAGVVSTLAGGPLTATDRCGYADGTGRAARFRSSLPGLALDAAGNVYVSDGANLSVRKISPAGEVTTLAR